MILLPRRELALPGRHAPLSRQRGFLLNPYRYAVAGGGSVKSLLHFDGSNGSTTFTDETGIVWTPSGNAQISTAQSVFGGASGLFDGNNDYISATDSNLVLGAGDFCIEGRSRKTGQTSSGANLDGTILDWRSAEPSQNIYFVQRGASNNNTLSVYINGSYVINSGTLSLTTWYAWAIERVGSTITLYVGGTAVGTASNSNNFSSSRLVIGGRFAVTGTDYRSFNGHIDEFRLTTGGHQHNGNYTPAGAPFTYP